MLDKGWRYIFTPVHERFVCFKPGRDTAIRTVNAGSKIKALATDSYGNLYKLEQITYTSTGKKGVKISKTAASKVDGLSAGAAVAWDSEYFPKYTPPASSGDCYPSGLDVDNNGNVYIADVGDSEGYIGRVSGIYKYSTKTGKISTMSFSANSVQRLTWLYAVSVDEFGREGKRN